MKEHEVTTLGGTLKRSIIGKWSWSDGTPAAEVEDLHWREVWPNYRIRNNSHVEVMVRDIAGKCKHLPPMYQSAADLAKDLAWVPEVSQGKAQSGDHGGMRVLHDSGRITRAYADPVTGETTGEKVIPEVYLVPISEWDRRAREVMGATWDTKHEEAILTKARNLGWKG